MSDEPRKLRVLDLFSGIGGFSLGLERAGGFETAAFFEIDPFCRKVLAKHWPDVPIFEDVRTIDATGLGRIDVVTGGYPCQPFSLAGQRKGEEDDRHLWPAMLEVIKAVRPAWVIGENVAGHISMGLDQVLSDLEGCGYAARPFVIPACAVDAPHRRDRIWIAANCIGSGLEGHAGHGADGNQSRRQREEAGGSTGEGGLCGAMADTDSARREEQRWGKPAQSQHQAPECGSQWKPEPAVGRVAHGIPRRVDRLKGLGNAVVPQIPEMIGRAILEAEKQS